VTPGRRHVVDNIPEGQPVVVGINIRTLHQRKRWSQTKLSGLMGWQSASSVCAGEGRAATGSAGMACRASTQRAPAPALEGTRPQRPLNRPSALQSGQERVDSARSRTLAGT
jgi:hypothetical protein